MSRYSGVHCVLYALFNERQELDPRAMARQVAVVQDQDAVGFNVLGLATEAHKLTADEKCRIIGWAAEERRKDKIFSVTVSGNSVAEQSGLAAFAAEKGADFLILQPPTAGAHAASEYLEFFCRVGASVDLPFAIQNAPQYLGRSLSDADIEELGRRSRNFELIKAETSAPDLAALTARCGSALTVLNGRGGLEMTDCLRAGCAGFIVAPDVVDHVARVFASWKRGDTEAAETSYQRFLPAAVFAMQSIEGLICYGKRIFGRRAGIEIFDRAPALRPTRRGVEMAERWADHLGPFG